MSTKRTEAILKMGTMIVFYIFLVFNDSQSQILFEDNFDNHPDWSPSQGVECWKNCNTAPKGYVGYRSQASGYVNPGHNTLNIDSVNHRGSAGKALTIWNETPGSTWASDGLLFIGLPDTNGYPKIYARFYVKFQSQWQWSTFASSQQKFFRMSHFDGGNPSLFFQDGNHHPLWIADLAKFQGGKSNIAYIPSFRYENSYYPENATPSHDDAEVIYFYDGNYGGTGTDFKDQGMMGDGEWHCWEFYLKANSAPGIPDGVHRFWQDGNLIAEVTDLAWADLGAQSNPRKYWNYVQIGGNNFNCYAPIEAEAEQWYAIDDLVISTKYIDPDYIIGSPWFYSVTPDTLIDDAEQILIKGLNFGSATDIADATLEIADNADYDNTAVKVRQQITAMTDSTITFDAQLNNLSSTNGLFYIFFTSKDGSRSPKGFPIYLITNVNANPSDLPETFQLFQNYPNPFNPSTVISFNIVKQGRVFLSVYDMRGQRIKILVAAESMNPGYKQVEWNGRDESGHSVPSGIYFYKLESGAVVLSRKMLLLR